MDCPSANVLKSFDGRFKRPDTIGRKLDPIKLLLVD